MKATWGLLLTAVVVAVLSVGCGRRASSPGPLLASDGVERPVDPSAALAPHAQPSISGTPTPPQPPVRGGHATYTPEALPAEKIDVAPRERRVVRRATLAINDVDSEALIDQRLYEDAKYLSSDDLQGRGIRTNGIDLAADYIAEQFDKAGLRTDLYGGTPFHPFNYGSRVLVERQALTLFNGRRPWKLEAGEFQAFRLGASGKFDLPLVFAGYGITALEHGYDDYQAIDVRGKAVIVLRHEPRWRGKGVDSKIPRDRGQDRASTHALIASKVAVAMERGAKAVLLCTDQAEIDMRREADSSRDADRLLRFNSRSGKSSEIPVFHCRREVIERLIRAALGESLAALEAEIDEHWAPASAQLPDISVQGDLSIRRRGRQLKNVIGMLEPSDPDSEWAEETIVIGAHYDHLGFGGGGSLAGSTRAIHNGADDNASGTVSMIEVARQLAARGPWKRRILFMAFSAEESGLVGSARYTRAPYVPMKDTIAMLNLDMVGRLGKSMEIHGTRTAKEFNGLIDEFAPKYSLRVRRYGSGYGPSDHSSFYEHGVPVLHFFTGLHKDYHRPSDDYDKLNVEGMRKITLLTRDIAMALATAEKRPERQKVDDLFGLEGLDLDLSMPSRRKVKLGVRARDLDGKVELAVVYDRTPAKRAGLRKGDIVTTLDGEAMRGTQQFLDLIRKAEDGKTVTIGVRRGSVELEMEVKLGQ